MLVIEYVGVMLANGCEFVLSDVISKGMEIFCIWML